jgi:anti-sigma factor RsiW
MTCEECSELLGGAVDASLDPAQEAALRAHCGDCDDCRNLLRDLIEIRRVASTLDRHAPSAGLRKRIDSRLSPRYRFSVPLAAAAALMLIVGGTSWFYVTTNRTRMPADGAGELVQSAESELKQAEQHYDKAIAALEQLTADRQKALDPEVADNIARGLAVIDKAIGESRAALRTEPDSILAETSLLEALRMKVSLLRETMSLMNNQNNRS